MTPHLPRRITTLAACGLVVVSVTAGCGHAKSPGSAYGAGSGSSSSPGTATTAAEELTPTKWGPLSSTDKKLITIVRETSLREITTSKWALQRSSNPKIKQAAQMIIKQHVVLDKKVLALGAKLGMQLPN